MQELGLENRQIYLSFEDKYVDNWEIAVLNSSGLTVTTLQSLLNVFFQLDGEWLVQDRRGIVPNSES